MIKIFYLLSKYVSKTSAIGFSLQVWGGVPDGVYYGIDKAGNGFNGFSHGNEFAVNKSYAHLNFLPTVLGQKKASGVDLIANNILSILVGITIQL